MTRCDFTLDEYRRYLSLAVAEGYSFVSFESLDDGHQPTGPEILLRHDVDYAPKYLPAMAAIEADLGVRATYCLHVDSPWYSPETPDNRAAISETLDGGHWLGLHFDASSIESDRDVLSGVTEQANRLGDLFTQTVRAVSFHMPGRRPVDHLLHVPRRREADDLVAQEEVGAAAPISAAIPGGVSCSRRSRPNRLARSGSGTASSQRRRSASPSW